jgi:hypothetical protein
MAVRAGPLIPSPPPHLLRVRRTLPSHRIASTGSAFQGGETRHRQGHACGHLSRAARHLPSVLRITPSRAVVCLSTPNSPGRGKPVLAGIATESQPAMPHQHSCTDFADVSADFGPKGSSSTCGIFKMTTSLSGPERGIASRWCTGRLTIMLMGQGGKDGGELRVFRVSNGNGSVVGVIRLGTCS